MDWIEMWERGMNNWCWIAVNAHPQSNLSWHGPWCWRCTTSYDCPCATNIGKHALTQQTEASLWACSWQVAYYSWSLIDMLCLMQLWIVRNSFPTNYCLMLVWTLARHCKKRKSDQTMLLQATFCDFAWLFKMLCTKWGNDASFRLIVGSHWDGPDDQNAHAVDGKHYNYIRSGLPP